MLAPGIVLQDRYTIQRHLASGGMGAVYLATDDRFRNVVAIKQAFFTSGDSARAFEREARLLRNLRHPALPGVIDFFEEDGTCYLVMDYVDGDDLGVLLKYRLEAKLGPFPYGAVVAWGDQILDALEFLHQHDPPILHRDIKPQNLKLTAAGRVILLDFGLSKGAAGDMSRTVNDESISGYTPSYSPPEQMRGDGTTERSDLFSLAATLYHLLTGVKPMDAVSRSMKAGSAGPDPVVRVDALNGNVLSNVADVVERAMDLDAVNRYASASEMRTALAAALPDPDELMRSLEQVLEQIPEPSSINREDEFVTARSGRSGSSRRTRAVGANGVGTVIAEMKEDRRRLELRMWIAVGVAALALVVSIGLFMRWRQLLPMIQEQAAESAAVTPAKPAAETPNPDLKDVPSVDLGEGVSIAIVRVPAGSFIMGAPTGESDERPPHRVTITHDFGVSMFEVTQAQWSRVMPSNPSPTQAPDLPVSNISWTEAQEFVAALNERFGGGRFRLPTEAEWEYACRAGTTGDFSGNLDVMAWHGATSGDRMRPIGTRAPNTWGLFDMHGNVWEWCSDFYGPYAKGDAVDPAGPTVGTYKVIRGGAFDEPGEGCRSPNRNLEPPGKRDGAVGLRLVRELDTGQVPAGRAEN